MNEDDGDKGRDGQDHGDKDSDPPGQVSAWLISVKVVRIFVKKIHL